MANTVERYQAQNGAARLPDLLDRMFNDSWVVPTFFDRSVRGNPQSSLPTNLFETPEAYVMHLALPGLKPDNVEIQVTGREISIRGKIEVSTPEGGNWIWRSIPTGEFYETFALPMDVDRDNVQASYDSGILTLGLPKANHVKPKTIKVQLGK